ncbi:transposase [Bradyrhizobium sp. S3.2.12]
MAKPLSDDLRIRTVRTVEGGMSRRAAAERFGISVASAVRFVPAGIVDQDIRLGAGLEHGYASRRRRDVAEHLGDLHARIGIPDLVGGLLQGFGAARGQRDVNAGFGQRDGGEWRESGATKAKRQGGKQRSQRIEKYHDAIMSAIEAKPDMTLVEIAEMLKSEFGTSFAPSSIWRVLDRHSMTFIKVARSRAG